MVIDHYQNISQHKLAWSRPSQLSPMSRSLERFIQRDWNSQPLYRVLKYDRIFLKYAGIYIFHVWFNKHQFGHCTKYNHKMNQYINRILFFSHPFSCSSVHSTRPRHRREEKHWHKSLMRKPKIKDLSSLHHIKASQSHTKVSQRIKAECSNSGRWLPKINTTLNRINFLW